MKRWGWLILGLLSACGPVIQTEFELVPPPTESGRMCANNCLLSKQNCGQYCDMTGRQCEEIERLRAQSDYLSYVNQQQRENRPIKKTERDFYRYYRCDSGQCAANCESDFRICYNNCGGQVIPHSYCTAFCD